LEVETMAKRRLAYVYARLDEFDIVINNVAYHAGRLYRGPNASFGDMRGCRFGPDQKLGEVGHEPPANVPDSSAFASVPSRYRTQHLREETDLKANGAKPPSM